MPSYDLAVATASERQHALPHGYKIASSCGGQGGGHKHLQLWGKQEQRVLIRGALGSELRQYGDTEEGFFPSLALLRWVEPRMHPCKKRRSLCRGCKKVKSKHLLLLARSKSLPSEPSLGLDSSIGAVCCI